LSLVLLLGGARSGKSRLAVELAAAHAGGVTPVSFVATGEARDDEMAARIKDHRSQRPAGWCTVEERVFLAGALSACDPNATVVLDCLTLWVSNILEAAQNGQSTENCPVDHAVGAQVVRSEAGGKCWADDDVISAATATAALAAGRPGLVVVVSNEVGSGIVPAAPLTRRYRDLLGRVNAAFAGQAAAAYLVVAGRLLQLLSPAEAVAAFASGTSPKVVP